MIELFRALAILAEPPGPEQARLAGVLGLTGVPQAAEYTDVFGFQLYPYASVYLGAEGMMGGDARDRVAGFWRALRRVPPPEPDHLTALLGLYAVLVGHEDAEEDPARRLLWRQGRKALMYEHLACWLFPYLDRLSEIAPAFYRSWGALLAEAIVSEIDRGGPPDALPLHLRLAPPLPDPRRDGADVFVQGLLSPVRSGVVLVRRDLARASRDLGLGLRMGERRFILSSLLGQDAQAMLPWLAAEALRQASGHREHESVAAGIARFWADRAAATAALLSDLRPVEVPR